MSASTFALNCDLSMLRRDRSECIDKFGVGGSAVSAAGGISGDMGNVGSGGGLVSICQSRIQVLKPHSQASVCTKKLWRNLPLIRIAVLVSQQIDHASAESARFDAGCAIRFA